MLHLELKESQRLVPLFLSFVLGTAFSSYILLHFVSFVAVAAVFALYACLFTQNNIELHFVFQIQHALQSEIKVDQT